MAYGLKYELLCKSRLDNLYKLKLSFDGYEGSEIDRNLALPGAIKLRKDKAGIIRGTSLEFTLREEVDFEFLEFYSNNAKYIKAQLYLGSTLLWTGYVAPQQYQATYKPAPSNITFTATDGLGLLKNEDFTLTGSQDQLAIIRHCLDKIGLNLGYSIAIDLYETNHNETYSPLSQTYEDASLYADDNCYEVLEKILGKYNAEISQCGGRWRIVCDNDKKSTPKLYTYAGVYESAGSAPSVLDLGYLKDGADVSPVGTLQMGMEPGAKKVKITHDFGRKDSWLTNYDFTEYESSMFTGWNKNGSFDVLQREHEGKKYAFLNGYSNTGVDYIHQSISVVNTDADDFVFEIDVAPIGFLSHGYSSKSSIQMTVKMLIRLYDGDSTYYYLGTEGWETSETYLEIELPSSIRRPVWNKISITTSALPCSGTLLVRLYRFQASSEPENTTYTGIAYSNVDLYSLYEAQLLPGILETIVGFDNSSEPGTLSDIKIFIADAPDYDNAGLIYKYITRLSDGSPTGPSTWYRFGSEDEYSLIVQLARMLASNNRVARQKLTGTIKGSSLAFDSIIKHVYNDNREFEIAEGTWDLYEEKWNVTLLEVLSWSDEDITFSTETSQGSSSSGGSSSVVTGIVTGNPPEMSGEDILTKLLDVDGPGSLLDADLLDGHEATYFATADHLHTDTYIPLIDSPTSGKFPTINAIGGLNNSSYGPSSFEPAISKSTGYLYSNGTTWSFKNETYIKAITGSFEGYLPLITATGSLIGSAYQPSDFASSTHNHSGVYQPLDSDLTAIAALSGDGILKKTSGTWGMDTTGYQPADAILTGICNGLTGHSGGPHFVKMTGPSTFSVDTSSYQPLDSDLTAIAALSGDGILTKESGTWKMDSNSYAQVTLQGDDGDIIVSDGSGDIYSSGNQLSDYADVSHNHSAADITSGTLNNARLNQALSVTTSITAPVAYIDGITLQDSTDRTGLLELSCSGKTYVGIQMKDDEGQLWSMMGSHTYAGIYDDTNSSWHVLCSVGSFTRLCYDGSTRLQTSSTGVTIYGVNTSTSFATPNWTIAESGNELQFKRGASQYLTLNEAGATAKILQGDGAWISKGDVFTAFYTLGYSASKTWDIDNGYNAKITLTGDCVLTITNADDGCSGCLIVIQDASGGHTLSFAAPTYNKVIDGGFLTLNESANAINILTFVSDGTNLYWSYGNNYLSPS